MKVSDYISQFLVQQGIRDLFLISGGGMMHMLDSVGKQDGLNLVFNLNEQASGICAESYGQYTNHLGACMVTTGPGATNAVTGCAAAWMDSTPVLFLSGQTKTADMGQLRGLRFYGAQEVDIISMVRPTTKYAVTVLKKEDIRYHLEKAVWLATYGRRGPVWVDVPLDVQGGQVNETRLRGFDAEEEGLAPKADAAKIAAFVEETGALLRCAKRPAVLMGHGVVAAGMEKEIVEICETLQIPALATWRAKGVFADDDPLYMGCPGIPAVRFSNYVLQNTDFLLILGTRLNPALTAYQEDNFAPAAKKAIVDIDTDEIKKLTMDFAAALVADVGDVLPALAAHVRQNPDYDKNARRTWLDFCCDVKNRYPLSAEVQPLDNEGLVDGYRFSHLLAAHSKESDVYVGSPSGRTCPISHMAYPLKKGQKFVTSMGLGSMGWCLPSAIACCFASGKRRTLTFEGDGSLQHNIQELALIQTYRLPIKLFILSNAGYASIHAMQRNNFKNRFLGCVDESDFTFPNLQDIAKAYNLPYYRVNNDGEAEAVLQRVMADDAPAICEVMSSIYFDEIPKSMTVAKPDGTFESSRLENLYPYVSPEEQELNLPNWSEA